MRAKLKNNGSNLCVFTTYDGNGRGELFEMQKRFESLEKTMVSMVGMSYIPQICLPPVAGKDLDIHSNLLNRLLEWLRHLSHTSLMP